MKHAISVLFSNPKALMIKLDGSGLVVLTQYQNRQIRSMAVFTLKKQEGVKDETIQKFVKGAI